MAVFVLVIELPLKESPRVRTVRTSPYFLLSSAPPDLTPEAPYKRLHVIIFICQVRGRALLAVALERVLPYH
eukprot:scaffold120680_cov41-Prasinocladus_malaysianus.AAC.1